MAGKRKKSKLAVLLTVVVLCACSREAAPPPVKSSSSLYEAHCKEPLPVFTLGEKSHPTKAQEASVCSCVWENLQGWERDTSEKIAQGKESEVSWMHMRGFMPRFGSAIEKCGGMKL